MSVPCSLHTAGTAAASLPLRPARNAKVRMAASRNSGLCHQKDAGSSIACWDVSKCQTTRRDAARRSPQYIHSIIRSLGSVRSRYSVYHPDPDHGNHSSAAISVPKLVTVQTVLTISSFLSNDKLSDLAYDGREEKEVNALKSFVSVFGTVAGKLITTGRIELPH